MLVVWLGNAAANATITAKSDAKIEFEELRTVPFVDENDKECEMVVSRLAEIRFVDPNTGIVLLTDNVPYGSSLYFKSGDTVKKGDMIVSGTHSMLLLLVNMQVFSAYMTVIEGVTTRLKPMMLLVLQSVSLSILVIRQNSLLLILSRLVLRRVLMDFMLHLISLVHIPPSRWSLGTGTS